MRANALEAHAPRNDLFLTDPGTQLLTFLQQDAGRKLLLEVRFLHSWNVQRHLPPGCLAELLAQMIALLTRFSLETWQDAGLGQLYDNLNWERRDSSNTSLRCSSRLRGSLLSGTRSSSGFHQLCWECLARGSMHIEHVFARLGAALHSFAHL